jgi:hypothetical protein
MVPSVLLFFSFEVCEYFVGDYLFEVFSNLQFCLCCNVIIIEGKHSESSFLFVAPH